MPASFVRLSFVVGLSIVLCRVAPAVAQDPPRFGYLEGHQGPVRAVAYAPDGKTIVTAGFDRTIKVWDRETGELIRTIAAHRQPILSPDVSRDGLSLVSGDLGGVVKLFDVPLRHPLAEFSNSSGVPTAVAVSADGTLLAIGDDAQKVKLLSPTDGKTLRSFSGPTGAIAAMALLGEPKSGDQPETRYLLAAAADGSLHVWNADTAAQTGLVNTPNLRALAVHPNGKALAAGGEDGLIRILAWPPVAPVSLPGHSQRVAAVVISEDGRTSPTAPKFTPSKAIPWRSPPWPLRATAR